MKCKHVYLLLMLFVGALTFQMKAQKSEVTIKGKIVDSKTQEPIIGASVQIAGTTTGAQSDLDGAFVLKLAPNSKLKISYIGYVTKEITVTKSETVVISLVESAISLNEVVLIGYGKVKKGDLSASVATVSNIGQLKERPIQGVEEMLQGQIPGVTVVSQGGHLDSKPAITIRGMGSRAEEKPLFVVDGVPNAPFNIGDVVSMTVLKDTASAAIYGAYAGSAGVIIVTTKRASEGKPTFQYNMVTGVSKATNLPQSLTIDEERRVRATALGGVNKLPDGWDPNKNPYIAETRTDWIKAIFRNAMFQRHNMSLSGGTETFNNLVSFEYSNKNGTLLNTYNREWTTRLNSMYKLSDHIRVREDLTWQKNQLRDANTYSAESGVILSALMMPRNAEVYAPDGSFGGTAPSDKAYITKYGSNFADIHGDVINPVRTLTAGLFENHHSTISSSTFLDIMEPIRGLNFTSRFTYQLENYFDKKFSPKRLEPGKPFDRNFMGYSTFRTTNWSTENTITYERIFNKNSVSLMASTTASEAKYRDFSASAEGFYNEDPSLIYFGQAGKFNPAKDGFWLDRNLSFVVRASYSYDNKYFFSGSWRRDYAGRLPKGRKYGDFPSATLAWKLSSEPFMKDMEALNLLKFRMSWGRIGNLGSIGMGYGYPLLQNYRIGDGDIAGQVGNPPYLVLGKYVAEGYNPNLTWETSEQTNFGIDLGLFDNRLSLTMDYFIKNTKDLIKKQDAGWSHSIGYDPQLVNDGKIRNSGFEMSANWSDKVGALKYWVGGNFATLKNKVISMGQTNSPDDKVIWTDGGKFKDLRPFQTEVGQPIYSFFLVKNSGVFTTKQEIDSYVDKDGKKIQPKAQIGDLKFVDENGDGKISNADRVYMGNAMPKLTYALSGGVSYKNFTFSMMLQGVAGVKIFNAYKYLTLNESQGSFNRSRDILKALDGPNKAVPRITADDPNENFTTPSDFYLEKGDYLRIKNITLGYSLTDLVRKMSLFSTRNSTLDLTFSIDNVATFTSYSGIDPEVGGTGIDAGQYPISRTFSIGLKLNY